MERTGAKTLRLKGIDRPKQRIAWSHQDELKSLRGQRVKVQFVAGGSSVGVLVDADPFTIKLLDHKDRPRVLFKHAVASFAPAKSTDLDGGDE